MDDNLELFVRHSLDLLVELSDDPIDLKDILDDLSDILNVRDLLSDELFMGMAVGFCLARGFTITQLDSLRAGCTADGFVEKVHKMFIKIGEE